MKVRFIYTLFLLQFQIQAKKHRSTNAITKTHAAIKKRR